MAATRVLMIEPKNFISNPETVGDNFFQSSVTREEKAIALEVRLEFDSLVEKIRNTGIQVDVFKQDDKLETPDAIYPNNWFSTLPGNTLILYPMMAKNRRLERRPEIIAVLKKKYTQVMDLTHDEERDIFLEGTGSLVADHLNKIAYASLSRRTDMGMLHEWSKMTGYSIVLFSSYDSSGRLIYHTNVMMCVGEKFAILCSDALADNESRQRVRESLEVTRHEIIPVTRDQMEHFCANCLELENASGEHYLVMSTQAYRNFTEDQLERIQKYAQIIHSDLTTIETHGGGGARCMLAELF